MVSAIATKLSGALVQIVLAWFLAREDFGFVGLAYTVSGFCNLLRFAGVRQVLVRRQRSFHLWAPPATWLSGTMALVAASTMLALAPLAERLYDAPQIVGLIGVLSISSFFQGISVVPIAKLEIDLRLQTIAALHIVKPLLSGALSVFLAWRGFGAFSFVVPLAAVEVAAAFFLWIAYGPKVKLRPRFRRWKFIFSDSLTLFGAGMATYATSQMDYVMLGAIAGASVVGLYYFSYNLSVQTIIILTMTLTSALFPSLSKLSANPERQISAFLRSVKLLAFVGIPMCVLQAVVAGPLIHIFFKEKWYDAILLVQILSIGMSLRVVAGPCHAMMQAQGKFKRYLGATTLVSALFIASVLVGVTLGQAKAVAIAVAVFSLATGPLYLLFALKDVGNKLREIVDIYTRPAVASALALSASIPVLRAFQSSTKLEYSVECVAAVATFVAVYVVSAMLLMRGRAREVWKLFWDLLLRRKGETA